MRVRVGVQGESHTGPGGIREPWEGSEQERGRVCLGALWKMVWSGGNWRQVDWGEKTSPEPGLWGRRGGNKTKSKGAGWAGLWAVRGQRRWEETWGSGLVTGENWRRSRLERIHLSSVKR